MAVTLVGVSHHGAPIAVRERLNYRASEIDDLLHLLQQRTSAGEAVALSTCNRTELYLAADTAVATAAVWEILSARLGEDASPYGYVRRDREAVTHLFRVASGLDSMILGEAQIHGQVRDAWEMSRTHSGAVLNRLFQTALLVAGRVRSETGVGRGAASVSSAAVQIAKQIFGSLAGKRAMVLGAGEMAELALECLVGEGVRTAIVANRTIDRARTLAEQYGARAIGYEEAWGSLADVDVLLCSTAAPHTMVAPAHIAPALPARRGRPLCVIDIAVPRDVDEAVGRLENVFLYDLDDLHAVVASNMERRREEMAAAEELIEHETARIWDWMTSLAVIPTLTQFRTQLDALRQREVDHALHRMAAASPEQREALEQFSRALMNKFLHQPTVRLRSAASDGHGSEVVEALRYLFALEPRTPPPETGGRTPPPDHHHATRGERE